MTKRNGILLIGNLVSHRNQTNLCFFNPIISGESSVCFIFHSVFFYPFLSLLGSNQPPNYVLSVPITRNKAVQRVKLHIVIAICLAPFSCPKLEVPAFETTHLAVPF
jgi:hypothetical protein